MRTLKFKVQPTNAFFVTVNQMFDGSSQLPTTAERAVIKSLSTFQTTKQCSAAVGRWEEPPNIWLMVTKNAFVGWALNFRVLVLLKGAVTYYSIFFDTLTAFTGGQNFAANHVSILSSLTSPPPGLKTTHLLIGLAGMRTLKRKQSKCDIKHFNISCS